MKQLASLPAQPEFAQIFRESRDHGLQPASIAALGREWAPRVGISPQVVSEYLADDFTILAYKLLNVKGGYTYEVTWVYN